MNLPNSPPAPVGQQAPPARAAASAVGTPRCARVPPVNYRDGLHRATASAISPQRREALDPNQNRKHHPHDPRARTPPGGRYQIGMMAGFISERVASIKLECMAGFIGMHEASNRSRTTDLAAVPSAGPI
jgi:hypothetical protein